MLTSKIQSLKDVNDGLKSKISKLLQQLEVLVEKESNKVQVREHLFDLQEFEATQSKINYYKTNIDKLKGQLKMLFNVDKLVCKQNTGKREQSCGAAWSFGIAQAGE